MVRHDTAPRLATVKDAAEVGKLLHEFNTEFGTPTPGARVLGDRLIRLLSEGSVFAILAGEPAIAVALFTVRPNVWYAGKVGLLDELYVVPEFRNQGIGSAVIDLLHKHARASGIDAVEINVDEGDIDAQRFYERHGYSSIEPDTNERAFYYFQELREPIS
jgi:GNAT superfamily N-acetyltransferase